MPFGLDGAAMFCSVLAVREASHGDAALGSRLLVWTFAGAAAWFNWVHAPRGMDHAGAPHFFAGMSLSAAVLFDRALKQTRRAALREQGLVPRPLPQIRIVRWLRAPRETFGAWSLMLLEGVRTLDEAVDEVREDRKEQEQTRLRRREQAKLDRARIKALNRQNRAWGRGIRGGQQVDVPALAPSSGGAAPAVTEPAIAEPGQLPLRPRPSLQAVGPKQADGTGSKGLDASNPGSDPRTVDLTAEDDTRRSPGSTRWNRNSRIWSSSSAEHVVRRKTLRGLPPHLRFSAFRRRTSPQGLPPRSSNQTTLPRSCVSTPQASARLRTRTSPRPCVPSSAFGTYGAGRSSEAKSCTSTRIRAGVAVAVTTAPFLVWMRALVTSSLTSSSAASTCSCPERCSRNSRSSRRTSPTADRSACPTPGASWPAARHRPVCTPGGRVPR